MRNDVELVNHLIDTGKFLFEKNLAWGSAGNISARCNRETFYISASGTKLGNLKPEHLVFYPVNDSNSLRPSKEVPMHDAIYKERPDIGAIIHAAPFYSTLIACSDLDIASNLFVETMYYLENVERVPYEHPGSQELADAVKKKAKKTNILLLENHGVLVYEKNIDEALVSLQVLEMASKMKVLSMSEKVSLKGLSENTVKDFLENSNYKYRRKW